VVDCHTSQCIWRTLEKAFAFPSNSHIIQLYGSFQDLRQGDSSVSIYIQQAKSLFDELAVVGRPMSLKDFNLYVFHGLHGEFKDLVTSLITKTKLMLYADLHNHLLTHEFLHKNSIFSIDANSSLLSSPLLPQPPLLLTPQPSTHLAMSHHSLNFSRNRGVLVAISVPTTTATITRTGSNLLQTGGQIIGSKIGATQRLDSGLDSRISGANCAQTSATQLLIVPSFAIVSSSPMLSSCCWERFCCDMVPRHQCKLTRHT
jgi:hypothetical protein